MKLEEERCRWVISSQRVNLCWVKRHLVFELVWVFVLLLVQVDEVVCDALLAARLHVPADLEGVTGDVADLDVLRDGELLHLRDAAILGFTACVVEQKQNKNRRSTDLMVDMRNRHSYAT